MINEASIDTTDMAADWGNWLLKNTKIENCFDTNLKKNKNPNGQLAGFSMCIYCCSDMVVTV